MASVTYNEIATIVAALEYWKDATCGENEGSDVEEIHFRVRLVPAAPLLTRAGCERT